jgi:hypothetical protein
MPARHAEFGDACFDARRVFQDPAISDLPIFDQVWLLAAGPAKA